MIENSYEDTIYNWLLNVKIVSELTKFDWEKSINLNIFEFLSYLRFNMVYYNKQKQEIDKIKYDR